MGKEQEKKQIDSLALDAIAEFTKQAWEGNLLAAHILDEYFDLSAVEIVKKRFPDKS